MPAIDPTRAKVRLTYPHAATFYGLAADAAGRLYAGSEDHAVHVYDLAAAKKEPVARWTKHDNYVSAVAFVRRAPKPLVISGGYDRRLIWWDTAGGEALRTVEAHGGWVRDLAVLPDGGRVASCGDDMLVKLWETDNGRLVRTLEGHAKRTPQGHVTALYAVAVSSDGKFVAGGDRAGTVLVWEIETGKIAQTFQVPALYTYDPRQRKRSMGGIRALAFSGDGGRLAVGGIGQVENVDGLGGPARVEVWDWRKPQAQLAAGLQGHKGLVNALAFHPGGTWLIGAGGGSDGGFLGFWSVDQVAGEKKDVPAHRVKIDGHVHRFALNAAGNELYAAGYRKLDVWTLTG
jgi:WD40 repeat protein